MLTCQGQTFEGGISGQPDGEAHGAYAFCALGCLSILGVPEDIIPRYEVPKPRTPTAPPPPPVSITRIEHVLYGPMSNALLLKDIWTFLGLSLGYRTDSTPRKAGSPAGPTSSSTAATAIGSEVVGRWSRHASAGPAQPTSPSSRIYGQPREASLIGRG